MTPQMFRAALEELGITHNEKFTDELFVLFDADNSGMITSEEVLLLLHPQVHSCRAGTVLPAPPCASPLSSFAGA